MKMNYAIVGEPPDSGSIASDTLTLMEVVHLYQIFVRILKYSQT